MLCRPGSRKRSGAFHIWKTEVERCTLHVERFRLALTGWLIPLTRYHVRFLLNKTTEAQRTRRLNVPRCMLNVEI